jgi:VanZ family protein
MPITVFRKNLAMAFESTPRTLLRRLCLLLAAAIAFQLFYLGAQPIAVGLIPAPWDKLAHFVVFSVITALLWIGTAGRMPIIVIITVVAIGALDELHQAGLPGRTADAADFLVDVFAAVGVGAILPYVLRQNPRDR